ncbi:MAG: WHG domain-containing protein [Candidatus Limnocylindrales bacterium]
MPAAARTSRSAIVDEARALLERDGLDGLTMRAVADAVGVRAPSLYKHVADRDDLVRLVVDATVLELGERLGGVSDARPESRLRRLADEFRAFAHARPAAFGLLFSALPTAWRPDPVANAGAVRPIIEVATDLVGADHALDASRTLTAACVGFITMELAGAFRLGGSMDAAWSYLIDTLVTGLGRQQTRAESPAARGSSRR